MPQGSSAVRPTNGLYLLPYILYLWGTHNYVSYQMLQSTHQRSCSLHSRSWIQNQPQNPIPYDFPQSLTPNYGIGTG